MYMNYKIKQNEINNYWLVKQECDLLSRLHDFYYTGSNRLLLNPKNN